MDNVQIKELVDDKMNEIVREIQDSLSVETGDEAAWFFSGRWDDVVDDVSNLMIAYKNHEMDNM